MSPRELLVMLFMCAIWGVHFVVVKLAVAEVPPIFYAAMRMSLVAMVMAAFLRWRPGQMRAVLLGGVCFGGLNYAFLFSGLQYANASVAAVAIELYTPFATVLSVVFLGEHVGWRRILGIGLAFTGVAVIALGGPADQGGGDRTALGVGLVACGALAEAIGAISVKSASSFKPHQLLAWFAVVGAVMLWPMSFVLESGQIASIAAVDKGFLVGSILYSAVGASIIGHTSFYWLLQRLPVSQVAASALLTTVIAVLAGIVLLGDPFGPVFMAGGVMTLVGVGVVMMRTKPSTPVDIDGTDAVK